MFVLRTMRVVDMYFMDEAETANTIITRTFSTLLLRHKCRRSNLTQKSGYFVPMQKPFPWSICHLAAQSTAEAVTNTSRATGKSIFLLLTWIYLRLKKFSGASEWNILLNCVRRNLVRKTAQTAKTPQWARLLKFPRVVSRAGRSAVACRTKP